MMNLKQTVALAAAALTVSAVTASAETVLTVSSWAGPNHAMNTVVFPRVNDILKECSGGDLSVKVEYARGYARLLYERELHDRLLNEVLAADVRYEGYTLVNSIAQQQAAELLATADDYF